MATHSSILAWRIPMDRGAWRTMVHGVAKSWTRLSDSAPHSTRKLMFRDILLRERPISRSLTDPSRERPPISSPALRNRRGNRRVHKSFSLKTNEKTDLEIEQSQYKQSEDQRLRCELVPSFHLSQAIIMLPKLPSFCFSLS